MRYTKEKLYELLPAIYRQRDEDLGKPLEALLSVIAKQIEILEDEILKGFMIIGSLKPVMNGL